MFFKRDKVRLTRHRSERAIALHATFGLSNRLRALSAAVHVSKESGTRLYLIWEPDVQLWARFDELYHLPSFIHGIFPSKADAVHALGSFSAEFDLVETPAAQVRLAPSGVTYILSHVIPDFDGFTVGNVGDVLRRLEPVEDIILQEERFIASNPDIYTMIGVHIRMRTNLNTDMPGMERDSKAFRRMELSSDKIRRARESCHYSHFLKAIDRELQRNPSQRFLVAADSMVVVEALRSRFDERTIAFLNVANTARCDSTRYTRHSSCIKHALSEQRLLSRTRFIYTSYWSSFSEVAVYMSGLTSSEYVSGCSALVH